MTEAMTRAEKIAYLAKSDSADLVGRHLEEFLIYYLTKEYEEFSDDEINERYADYTED